MMGFSFYTFILCKPVFAWIVRTAGAQKALYIMAYRKNAVFFRLR